MKDVAERKLSEQQLQASEGRFQALFETAAQGAVAVDASGQIILVNAAAERTFGYGRDQILGQPLEMLLPESLRDVHRKHRTAYFSQPRPRPMGMGLDLLGRRRDGMEFPIEVSLSYLETAEGPPITVAFVSDITLRKAAEEKARLLAAIVESSDDAIFSKTLDGVITSWNRGAESIYGYKAAEVMGRSVSLLIPSDRPDELPEILKGIQKGEQIQHYETEHLRKDGRHITVSLTISPVRNQMGEVTAASAVARDITQKKQALEALRRLSKVFEEATDSIVIVDRNGLIVDLNKETEHAYGWTRKELMGQPLHTLIGPERRELCDKRIARCLRGEVIRNVEGERQKKSSERIPVSLTFSPVTDEKGQPTAVAVLQKDVSDLRRAEADLKRNRQELRELSAKLLSNTEEEGRRIARDLHDSLGPRLARLNLKVFEVQGQVSSRPELAEKLGQISKGISDVVKAIHDLSRQLHPAVLAQLGLKTALDSECASFSKEHGITVNFSAKNVPESLPDAVSLCLYRIAQESLQNIRQHAQAKTASVSLRGRGDEIVMVIRDFGRGFDKEAVRGRGGLGLVSMEERVRLVNGKLSVKSKPGDGSEVEVRIPIGELRDAASARAIGR